MTLCKIPYLVLYLFSFISILSCEKSENENISKQHPIQELLVYSSDFKVGVSSVNINPSNFEDISLEGYGYRTSIGLHDTLTAKTLVLLKDTSYIVLISLDLVGTTKHQTNKMKEKIFEYTGIPEYKIFVHSSHTHSGPSMLDGRVDDNYLNKLYESIANGVVNAVEDMQIASTIYKTGTSSVATVNRRNPEREVSNTYHVISFINQDNSIIASLLNFSCHPVVLGPNNLKITGDFVHYLRKEYEAAVGGASVFFNGYFGNINPARMNPGNAYDRSEGTFYNANQFGEVLANDMVNNYSTSQELDISINHKTIRGDLGFYYSYASILDFGDLQIALIPGEPLDLFAKEVENMLPGPYKMTFGNMYEHIGYIVPENEWEQCTNSFKPECYEEQVGGGAGVAPLMLEKYQELCNDMFAK